MIDPPYIPGRTKRPHPESATAHAAGDRAAQFSHGVDLFNRGYYWEAHEVWETLWHAAGRRGPVADVYRALIKLAAAGVKTRQGSATGRRRHAARAAELMARASESWPERDSTGASRHRGTFLRALQQLMSDAERIAAERPAAMATRIDSLIVFDLALSRTDLDPEGAIATGSRQDVSRPREDVDGG